MLQSGSQRTSDNAMEDHDDLINLSVENINQDFVCSRTELVSHSEYFNVMLSRYYKEDDGGVITLKGIDGNALRQLLQLMHTTSYSVTSCELPGVIMLSDMFLFERLKKQLIYEAYERLSWINCLKIWLKLDILSVTPLVWKAKSLSLTTFDHQRKEGFIVNLELSELITYLGHANLQCGSEMNVFDSINQWILSRKEQISEDYLKETLGCISYKDISLSELSDIKMQLSKYSNIVNILQYIIELKNFGKLQVNNENSKIARSWFSSRRRYLLEYLFVFNDDSGHEIFYHGHHKDRFLRKVSTVLSKSIDGLTGAEVQAYKTKVYIFGGEFSMGKGLWNENFWEFDMDTKQLINTEYGIPKRRHFKSCIVKDNLFIIGGTGPFRVRKNDMHWFNFTTKTWRETAIALPCCQTSIKYCNFDDQLFLLDCSNKHGYIFLPDASWKSIKISDQVQEVMEEFSSFSIFAYRGNLFFKGRKLMEMELKDDELFLMKLHNIPCHSNEILIDTSISCNRVYSMYTDQLYDGDISLQYLNLDTLESVYIENIGLYFDSYNRNQNCKLGETDEEIDQNFPVTLRYYSNKTIKMFFLNSYKYCAYEDLLVGDV